MQNKGHANKIVHFSATKLCLKRQPKVLVMQEERSFVCQVIKKFWARTDCLSTLHAFTISLQLTYLDIRRTLPKGLRKIHRL